MSSCIRGVGADNGKGYLLRRDPLRRRNEYVHRTAYREAHGEIPKGAVVRHTCDNRWCVNPDHLLVGSYADNTRDMYERNRQSSKIDMATAREIRASSATPKELREQYSLSRAMIYKIRSGQSWQE